MCLQNIIFIRQHRWKRSNNMFFSERDAVRVIIDSPILHHKVTETDEDGKEETQIDDPGDVHFDYDKEKNEKNKLRLVFKAARDGNVSFFTQNALGKVKHLVNSKDDVGNTPLHYAARNSDFEMVKTLISLKSDPETTGQNKMTPAHFAARYGKIDDEEETEDMSGVVLRGQSKEMKENTWETIKFLLIHSKYRDVKDKYGFTILHHAVYRGNLHLVKKLKTLDDLKVGNIKIDSKDEQKNTCLHLSAVHGHDHILKFLLDNSKLNLKAFNREQMTALHFACKGETQCVKVLLDHPSATDVINFGDKAERTPLFLAVASGKLDIVKLLLDHGASLAITNKFGESPLHFCARYGHADIMKLLTAELAKDSNLQYKDLQSGNLTDQVDGKKKTKKKWELVLRQSTVVKKIIKIIDEQDKMLRSPFYLASKHNHKNVVDVLKQSGANISLADHHNKTPLMIALLSGHQEISSMLLKLYSVNELKIIDNDGRNIMHYAIQAECSDGLKEVIKILQRRRLLRRMLLDRDFKGNCPLHLAAQTGSLGQDFRELLKNYSTINYNMKNDAGYTPLHLAVIHGHQFVVKCFLDKELNSSSDLRLLQEKDVDSNTLLHLATKTGTNLKPGIVELLLKRGLSIRCAASSGNIECLKLVLGYCKNYVDTEDNNKTTPLHLAAKNGFCEVYNTLVQHGADIALKDYKDRNVLELAIEKNQKEMVLNILQSKEWKYVMRSCRIVEYKIAEGFRYSKDILDTPMRLLIRKYPDLAEVALDRCYQVKQEDEVLQMNFEFIEDTYNYRDRTNSGPIWHTKKRPTYEHFSKVNNNNADDGFDKPYSTDHSAVMWNHPLMVMSRENKRDLLRHPLCLSLIRYKWFKVGRKLYYFNLLFYISFLATLTAYTLTIPNPAEYPEFYDCSEYFLRANRTQLISNRTLEEEERRDDINNVSWLLLVVFFTFRALQFFFLQEYKDFFKFVNGLRVHELRIPYAACLDFFIFTVTIYTLIEDRYEYKWIELHPNVDLRQCKVYAMNSVLITIAWLNLLTYMRQLPVIGSYIIIFHDVLRTFMSFILVFLIFVIAFALGFHMLFEYQEPFHNVSDALIKTVVMMSGEFDYENIFLRKNDGNGPVPFPEISYAVFVVFFVLLSIITLNLLIGLTVDDIKTFLDDADLEKIKMKLEYVLEIEKSWGLSWLTLFKIRQQYLTRSKSFFNMDDVVSKNRIWERVISQDIKTIKKENLEVLLEDQKQLKLQLNKIENLLGNLCAVQQTVPLNIKSKCPTSLKT
ncbi:transient receptor potential cation channel subfamily A member 1 homolog isoform X2 [Eurytemora carolleeae]|uniref:transient receptor potential cation channel subfamily A member 1 homolog isoform X2 n=1 Tax=Eurytemora carolleeae TaxID=1294199 RepID=UPI000C757005|nr:transient receptor potential cation channel subfamily A member 1 homolog isoform X2 [Eurytemora carolleeae]|eukprot:XP_023331663.1 transient receptor potential cation channel subfamily A member 1 homolog isoform X2 [Eurytemora affinis]